jgi:Carboxypeptidase regulatory-like domain
MHRRSSVLSLLILVVLCASLHGQTVDTAISGTVTDKSGAIIPGATVTVTSQATGTQKTAVTAATGEYSVNYLIPGTYDLAVSANGFSTDKESGIVLQINQQAKVNVVMQVGVVSQVVTVQAVTPLLQTQDASLGVVVGTESAANLPLNGRKFDDLAILTPGISVSDPDNHTNVEGGATISAYGNQNSWGQTNVAELLRASLQQRFAQVSFQL